MFCFVFFCFVLFAIFNSVLFRFCFVVCESVFICFALGSIWVCCCCCCCFCFCTSRGRVFRFPLVRYTSLLFPVFLSPIFVSSFLFFFFFFLPFACPSGCLQSCHAFNECVIQLVARGNQSPPPPPSSLRHPTQPSLPLPASTVFPTKAIDFNSLLGTRRRKQQESRRCLWVVWAPRLLDFASCAHPCR